MQQNFISFIVSTFLSVEEELVTPPLDGLILPGITRMSMLDLARQWVSYLRLVYTCNICCDFRCDFLLLMDVNEWISYECSDEGTCTPNICTSSTRSHASEGEYCSRNHSKKCKCI